MADTTHKMHPTGSKSNPYSHRGDAAFNSMHPNPQLMPTKAFEDQAMEEEENEDDEFPLLTKDRKADIKKFENSLRNPQCRWYVYIMR